MYKFKRFKRKKKKKENSDKYFAILSSSRFINENKSLNPLHRCVRHDEYSISSL